MALLIGALVLLGNAQFRSSSPNILVAPFALCARPAATIDLVLPPVDFVLTHSANALIGSKFKFEVAFNNTYGSNPGYGPYLNVIFPASGIDGSTVGPLLDGISFDQTLGATYLGSPLTPIVKTFMPVNTNTPLVGSVVHPFTGQTMTGATGDQLVVIELPFSSYTPQQPPAGVIVNAELSKLADINDLLTIRVEGGFRYGCSPTGSAMGFTNGLDIDTGTVTPVLFTIDKKCDDCSEIGPKMGETATGPNFPHHYTISMNVAPGQIITNLKVTDLLPDNLAFKGLTSIYPSGSGPPTLPPVGVAANNNLLIVPFPTFTGTGGTQTQPDIVIVFEFFIPDKDASGAWILNPNSGASAISENNATVEGNWTPLDLRDPSGLEILDPSGPEYTLVCKSIALEKEVINTTKSNLNVAAIFPPTDNAPKDVLLNTLNFKVSDYFTLNQLTVDDIISDGQVFLTFPPIYTPKFSVTDQLHSATASFSTANLIVTSLTCTGFPNGRTRALFTLPGSMTGGWALTTPSSVPAIGKITFYTRIVENYLCPVPSGDSSVDQNDKLFDRATINGTILNNSTLQPIGPMQDDTEVDFKLLIGLLSKSAFAHTDRYGVQTLSPPASKLFAPGDLITFRLTYKLPHGDIEKFSIADYLPMPVLETTQMSTSPLPVCAGIPVVNTACFQFGSLNLTGKPVVTKPPVNSLLFDYGPSFDDPLSPLNGKLIDILVTLEIQNDPFVDAMSMANQISSNEASSFYEKTSEVTIAQFKVAEPKLAIRKSALKTDNSAGVFSPGVTPPYNTWFSPTMITSTILSNPNAIHSNLSNVDAGDLVDFGVVVENLGSSPYGAFDVKVSDTIPPGFVVPTGGANLTVRDGTGVAIPFTGGATFFTPAGIELTDSSLTAGSLQAHSLTSGKNIAVITYTLQIDPQIGTCQKLDNIASITNYSSTEQGPNYADPTTGVSGKYTDTSSVTIRPTISKALIATNQPYTFGSNVTIGEEVTYEITVNLPEGTTPSLTVTDPLPSGLQATGVGPTSSLIPLLPAPIITPTLFPGACGGSVTLNFGAINVPVDNNPTNNWFKVQMKARVCNVPGNVNGTILNNFATVNSALCQSNSKLVPVKVVEPKLNITKQFTPAMIPANGSSQITLSVTNSGTSPAFDIVVEDPLPLSPFSSVTPVTTPSGWLFATPIMSPNTVATYKSLPGTSIAPNVTVIFTFKVVATNCGTLPNTATITHATTLSGPWPFERDEPPTSASASVLISAAPGTSCPCVAPPSGMVDWWKFDENPGATTANDTRLTNNSGADGFGSSAPSPWVQGWVANALCFDGINDYATVVSQGEVNFAGNCTGATESFSIDAWIKTPVANNPIIDKRVPGPIGYYLFLSSGRLGFQMNGINFVSAGPNIADNNWHFITVTVPRCALIPATLYVDGLQMMTFTPPTASLVNTASLQIGRNVPGVGQGYLRGCVDELEIFKRVLSATEVKLIHAAGRSGKCK
jgi:uncharacterized repeat protein (TIGR01451 family)/fimbrial isopeptide formation D2 family protein